MAQYDIAAIYSIYGTNIAAFAAQKVVGLKLTQSSEMCQS